MSHTIGPPVQELRALTGLRGFAAIWVVLCHYSPKLHLVFNLPSWVTSLLAQGSTSVQMFFILSGFIMVHAHPSGAQTRLEYWQFLGKRFARVYPVHLVTLLFAMLVVGPAPWGHPPAIIDYIKYLTLMQTWWNYSHHIWNAPSWSLSAEWGAYLLFPLMFLLMRLTRPRTILISLGGGMLAYLTVVILFASKNMGMVAECGLFHAIPCFAFGVLIYRLRQILPANPAWSTWLADACTATIIPASILLFTFHLSQWLFVPLYVIWILALSYGKGLTAEGFSSRIMIFFGTISFALYMVHYIVEGIAFDKLIPVTTLKAMPLSGSILFFALQAGIIFLLAWALCAWVEVPARKALLNWSPRRPEHRNHHA